MNMSHLQVCPIIISPQQWYKHFTKTENINDKNVINLKLTVSIDTEDDLIKRLNEWKDFVDNTGITMKMNKTNFMISGEWQKIMHNDVRQPCDVFQVKS